MSDQTIIFSFGKKKYIGLYFITLFFIVVTLVFSLIDNTVGDIIHLLLSMLGIVFYLLFIFIFQFKYKLKVTNNELYITMLNGVFKFPISSISNLIRYEGLIPSVDIKFLNNDKICIPKNVFFELDKKKKMDIALFLKDKLPNVPVEINTDFAGDFYPVYDLFYRPRIKANSLAIYSIIHIFIWIYFEAYWFSKDKTFLSNAIFVLGLIAVYYCVFKILQNPLTYKIFAKGAAIAMVVSSALLVLSHFIR